MIFNQPFVSVLLSVYNGEKFLDKAIQSILDQTYKNFEFIIINDGSRDKSLAEIQKFTDHRIVCINNKNKGLIASLNEGLGIAKGKYIIRMDADDICMPERIEKQVQYMEQHPDAGLCGTSFTYFNEKFETVSRWKLSNSEIKVMLLYSCPILHPTACIRATTLKDNNLNYKNIIYCEDLALWYDISKVSEIAILPEILLRYRVHANSISETNRQQQNASALTVYTKAFNDLFTPELETQKSILEPQLYLVNAKPNLTFNDLEQIIEFKKSIIKINKITGVHNDAVFKKITALNLYLLNYRFAQSFSLKLLWLYISKGYSIFLHMPGDKKLKFVVKCLMRKSVNNK